MKTIQQNSVLIFLLLIVSINSFATSNGATSSSDEIRLRGTIDNPGPPRVPPAPSLEAYLDFNVITVYFLNELGNVSITITDETGAVVHQSTEPSAYGTTALIDISGLDSGIYTITFRNDGSFYRYGEFEL